MTYDLIATNPLNSIGCLLVICSIISFWVKRDIRLCGTIMVLAIGFGLAINTLEPVALMPIFLFCLVFWSFQNSASNVIKVISGVFVALLSIALALHIMPGFHNWKVINTIALSSISVPYTQYFNFDKAFVGFVILSMGGFTLVKGCREWRSLLKTTLVILSCGLLILIPASILLNLTRWDPKLTDLFFVWGVNNLFITCFSEEVFFRGFLQKNITLIFEGFKNKDKLSLISTSVLFGVAHAGGGIEYVGLSTLAGFFYGYAFLKTKRIESSILVHFGVNAFHFIFLTYPRSI